MAATCFFLEIFPEHMRTHVENVISIRVAKELATTQLAHKALSPIRSCPFLALLSVREYLATLYLSNTEFPTFRLLVRNVAAECAWRDTISAVLAPKQHLEGLRVSLQQNTETAQANHCYLQDHLNNGKANIIASANQSQMSSILILCPTLQTP